MGVILVIYYGRTILYAGNLFNETEDPVLLGFTLAKEMLVCLLLISSIKVMSVIYYYIWGSLL